MPKLKTLRLRLHELRTDKGLSQAEMAKNLDISQQTYSRYETHTTEIPLARLVWLAEYFDVTTDYLLGVSDKRKRRK